MEIPSAYYKTSTEYFQDLVDNEIVSTYSLFGGGGVPVYKGSTRSAFSATYNAWDVISDFDPKRTDRAEDTPFIITRNNDAMRVNEMAITNLTASTPFGRAGVVIVMRDASSFYEDSSIDRIITNRGRLHNLVLSP